MEEEEEEEEPCPDVNLSLTDLYVCKECDVFLPFYLLHELLQFGNIDRRYFCLRLLTLH